MLQPFNYMISSVSWFGGSKDTTTLGTCSVGRSQYDL